MISSFIITFRETLEAALVIGIILAYLIKIKKQKYNNIVYLAVVAAIITSIIGALIFSSIAGGFTGRAEYLFEGVAMLVAAVMITFMIIWMSKQKQIAIGLHHKVDKELHDHHRLGLFFLVFISVLREGIETVIFLGAANFASGAANSIIGALFGIIAAIVLGYIMFVSGKKVNIKTFFNITSIMLILFAAGLVAHGIHEFQEAGVVPIVVEHVWDINPTVNADGTFPALHEKGAVGSIFKGLLGYNGNPSLIEVISYFVYLFFIVILYKNIGKKSKF